MHILKSQRFSDEELLEFALSLSKGHKGEVQDRILHWEFGPIMNLKFDSQAQNYLFSKERVPLHWDGAFYKVPSTLLFYCTQSRGSGGETFFVDTSKVWKKLPSKLKRACEGVEVKYQTQKIAHYGGEIRVPLLQRHPLSGEPIIRLAEKVETALNPVEFEIFGVSDPEEFYQEMLIHLYAQDVITYHRWEVGDLLTVDNFTYLHGRNELGSNINRAFKRIQIL